MRTKLQAPVSRCSQSHPKNRHLGLLVSCVYIYVCLKRNSTDMCLVPFHYLKFVAKIFDFDACEVQKRRPACASVLTDQRL